MSTLNVNNIDKESGSFLTIGGSGTTVNISNMVPDVALSNRNLIINGAMQVWQRGLTQTSTGFGCVDRWKNTVSGTTTFSQDTASLPTGFEYALRWTTGASSSYGQSRQYLETSTVKILRGRTLTASSYVKVSGSYSGYVTWEIAYSTTSDSAAGNTWVQLTETSVVTASASDASSDYKRISCNVDIPSNAVGLYIGIVPSATQASGQWVSVTGVQLEVGDVATPFEHRIYGEELALCQRYYYRLNANANYSRWGDGCWDTVTQASLIFPILVPMRSSPSVDSTGSSSDYVLVNAGSVYTCTSIPSFSKSTITSDGSCAVVTLVALSTGNGTAGNAAQLVSVGGGGWTGDFLGLDAEL